jgi:hypothetical protein
MWHVQNELTQPISWNHTKHQSVNNGDDWLWQVGDHAGVALEVIRTSEQSLEIRIGEQLDFKAFHFLQPSSSLFGSCLTTPTVCLSEQINKTRARPAFW